MKLHLFIIIFALTAHGQTNYVAVTNPVVFELYIPSPFLRYEVTSTNIAIHSKFKPVITESNGWRIEFKDADPSIKWDYVIVHGTNKVSLGFRSDGVVVWRNTNANPK